MNIGKTLFAQLMDFLLEDLTFQSLYHFTVGGPVDDSRLTTLAPYGAHAGGQDHP